MDYNSVTFQLRPNDPSLSRDDGFDTVGDIFDRNVETTSRPSAVQCTNSKSAQLKDGFTYRFAGYRAGVNAHASDHPDAVDYGDAFARLRRGDGTLLPGRAAADYNKVVFGHTYLAGLKSVASGRSQ